MQPYKLSDKDYLDLWKFFSEDTAKIKDKLWTIASWLYALMSGLLGFMFKFKPDSPVDQWMIWPMAIAGIFLSIYTWYMIREYGKHVRTGWKVTDFLRTKIEGLDEIWDSKKTDKEDDEQTVPLFARRLQWLALAYGIGFVAVPAMAFIQ